jgi:hypothetical protein
MPLEAPSTALVSRYSKPMPIPKNDPYRPRKCRFCKLLFKPAGKDRGNAQKQEFCTAAHRKEFWKHGGLPYQKLLDKLEKAVVKILDNRIREIVREEIEAAFPRNQYCRELSARTEPRPAARS